MAGKGDHVSRAKPDGDLGYQKPDRPQKHSARGCPSPFASGPVAGGIFLFWMTEHVLRLFAEGTLAEGTLAEGMASRNRPL
ncbi:hypothetical protein LCGC14_2583250 [marine sediment metagenome]|uniref:Uncharacterized protein n=1 Tax=marine sediment metagenome TaxID=412755 RepID=A0A0F9B1U0_9ZZZZ